MNIYQMYSSRCYWRRGILFVRGKCSLLTLQAKFCSTVANDVMLDTDVGVVRMWADETSRLSRFRMLFTSFADREFLPEVIPHVALRP